MANKKELRELIQQFIKDKNIDIAIQLAMKCSEYSKEHQLTVNPFEGWIDCLENYDGDIRLYDVLSIISLCEFIIFNTSDEEKHKILWTDKYEGEHPIREHHYYEDKVESIEGGEFVIYDVINFEDKAKVLYYS